MEGYDAIFANVGVIANGLIGSAVFNGDYMFSQQGIDSSGAPSTHYENFNTDNPMNESNEFRPNICINMNTGEVWFAHGNVNFKTDGSGSLAQGNISWDSDANVNLNNGSLLLNSDGSSSFAKNNLIIDPDGKLYINSFLYKSGNVTVTTNDQECTLSFGNTEMITYPTSDFSKTLYNYYYTNSGNITSGIGNINIILSSLISNKLAKYMADNEFNSFNTIIQWSKNVTTQRNRRIVFYYNIADYRNTTVSITLSDAMSPENPDYISVENINNYERRCKITTPLLSVTSATLLVNCHCTNISGKVKVNFAIQLLQNDIDFTTRLQ